MSTKLDIFNDIDTVLKLTVRTYDIWNGQLLDENDPEEIPRNHPSVYVQFTNIPWEFSMVGMPKTASNGNIIKEQKSGQSIVTLHIGAVSYKDVGLSFPEWDALLDEIYFAVQGLDGDRYTPLLRSNERQDDSHGARVHWEMDFTYMMQQPGQADPALVQTTIGKLETTVGQVVTNVDLSIDVATVDDFRTSGRVSPELIGSYTLTNTLSGTLIDAP